MSSLNRRVQSLEGDLETCEDKLLLATQKLDKVSSISIMIHCARVYILFHRPPRPLTTVTA